jgi:predicted unusual protein kinase regulating ubiquinone biosynthesis (AarF/ABC1/UbiB family)
VSAQDSIPQWHIDQVVNILDDSLQREFGLRFDDVFDDIDPVALGSASIGQVHRATIKQQFANDDDYNGGNTVAVKVMHPGAEERFHHDFKVFRSLCKVALRGWQPILDECYRQIMSEFDYRREAGSLDTIRQGMAKSPYWRRIRIPQPLPNLCTKNIIFMEMLHGKKLADSLEDELAEALGGDKDIATEFIARKRLGKLCCRDVYRPRDLELTHQCFGVIF